MDEFTRILLNSSKEFSRSTSEIARLSIRKSLVQRLLRIYTVIGVLVAAIGIGYIVLEVLTLSGEQRIAAAAIIGGLALSALSGLFSWIIKESAFEKRSKLYLEEDHMELLLEWVNFERAVKTVMLSKGNNRQIPFADLVEILASDGMIGSLDKEIVLFGMQKRNEIVHGEDPGLTEADSRLIRERLARISESIFEAANLEV